MAPMAARYRRPDWARRLIAMGESAGGVVEGARRLLPLDAESLVREALESLGPGALPDFGTPDWRDRFDALVTAIDLADLHLLGRLMSRQELFRCLRSRILLGRRLASDPGIAGERIAAPVIVTGPARSGTSILFELLWLDPELRAPLAYEALHPVPFAGCADAAARSRVGECEQEFWADVQPEFAAIHELRADLPVECVTLTAASFCGPHWAMVTPGGAPMDPVEDYAFHRRILQVLQRGEDSGRTWLLKTPAHLALLPLVFATYPDARVVQTHRDPARTMPSTVSTTAMVQWMRTDAIDLPQLVANIEAAFCGALNAVGDLRDSGRLPPRFVDVHFQELLRDPVSSLRAAYEGLERPFTREHAERVRAYLAEKPRGKFGVHRYTAEDWGFDHADLHQRTKPYIDRFAVELEEPE
jgi:hypothetical protein